MPADIEKIVKIIFSGDASPLAKTINSVGSGMDSLAGNIGTATQPLANFTDSVFKVDAALAAIAAGGLVVATTAAGRFGDSFNEISTLIDAPTAAIEGFRTELLNYAADSTASFDQITGATYNIISATGDWENALERLSVAERLNVAGKGELNDTAKILSTSMNAYGAASADAADYADVLFKTVKTGVTTLTELSASLGNVTGIAASAGVPFDDLAAAVAGLTGYVGDTSLAVTQIKSILTAVIKPSSQAEEAAKSLGIAFNQQALQAMGLDAWLRMVYEKTGGNAEVMAKLFGRVEGLNGALSLGADTGNKYADALKNMEERAGAVDAAYEKMADGFDFTNQRIINNLNAVLVKIGGPLLESWGDLADGLVAIFKGISIGVDEGSFKPLTDFIEKYASDLKDDFEEIAQALPEALAGVEWGEFLDSLDDLAQAATDLFGDLFGDIDFGNVDDLRDAIQKVIDTFENWVHLTTGIVEGIGPFITKIGDFAGKFSELDSDTVKSAGSIAGWGKAINVVSGIIPSLTAPIKLLSASIGLLSVTQIPAFISGLGSLAAPLGALVTTLTPAIAALTAFGGGYWFGTELREHSSTWRAIGDAVGGAAYNLVHWNDKTVESMEAQAKETQELGRLAVAAALAADKVTEIPAEKVVTIDSELSGFFAEVDLEKWKLDNLEGYSLTVTADTQQAEDALKRVSSWNKIILEDGTEINIPVKLDSQGALDAAGKTKAQLEKELPAEKVLELKLQGEVDIELAKIKATADTLQSAFEWQAKVDIADIEAQARVVEALAENIANMYSSAGEVIGDALGVIADVAPGTGAFYIIRDAIEAEIRQQEKLLELQEKLTLAQVDQIKARTEAIKQGKGLVTIKAEGLEAELQMVLKKIVELAQIEANSEGFDALLGI